MKIRSLFWTIFLTIVSVNLALIVANAYWLGVQLEKRNVKERFSENLDAYLVRLVDEYEERVVRELQTLTDTQMHSPLMHRIPAFRKKLIHQFQLEIVDLQTNLPLWPSPPPIPDVDEDDQWASKKVTSSSGRHYLATYLREPEINSPFIEILLRFGFLRWIMTLVFSIVGSYFLSRLIILPMKKLIQHTQNLANGDLSTRVEAKLEQRQDEVGQLSKTFNEMAERIQQLIEGQQSLLHDVSHELRAPLQRLQVNLELARDKYSPDASSPVASNQQQGNLFDRQQREIDKLRDMIDEILELARIGKAATPKNDSVNINQEIQSLVEYYQAQYPQKQIHLALDERFNKNVHINEALFERVMNNIIENAMKHTPDAAEVSIFAEMKAPNHAIISVSDNGQGVDAAMIHQLSQPFFRAPAQGFEKPQGNGLGLSIATKAAHALDGQLLVSQAKEGGLKVEFEFKFII